MTMREPRFWWSDRGVAALALSPLAAIYGAIARAGMRQQGVRLRVPVVCVGNFTLGGSGKTPAAIAIAKLLIAAGQKPVFLSRGYGGSAAGPLVVDPKRHSAAEIGDEPLLLAQVAPAVIAANRITGAETAIASGASVIVMDDGLQNPSLQKDFTISVIDGRRGLGNGMVFPAGPLRAPLDPQWSRTDAVLVVGDPIGPIPATNLPVFHAMLAPDEETVRALRQRKVLAFAGIGDPEKFYATLAACGVEAPIRHGFPDHYRYRAEDAGALVAEAERNGLTLVTTEKDKARMMGEPALAALIERARTLPVTLAFNDEAAFKAKLLEKIAR